MSDPGGDAPLAAVEESPVWLDVNGKPAVTWMCTPEQLEELCVGWLHGEGYIASLADLRSLRPCPTDLGFWAEVADEQARAAWDAPWGRGRPGSGSIHKPPASEGSSQNVERSRNSLYSVHLPRNHPPSFQNPSPASARRP